MVGQVVKGRTCSSIAIPQVFLGAARTGPNAAVSIVIIIASLIKLNIKSKQTNHHFDYRQRELVVDVVTTTSESSTRTTAQQNLGCPGGAVARAGAGLVALSAIETVGLHNWSLTSLFSWQLVTITLDNVQQ